ncbi:DMT family transporter [Streptomyces nogalater]
MRAHRHDRLPGPAELGRDPCRGGHREPADRRRPRLQRAARQRLPGRTHQPQRGRRQRHRSRGHRRGHPERRGVRVHRRLPGGPGRGRRPGCLPLRQQTPAAPLHRAGGGHVRHDRRHGVRAAARARDGPGHAPCPLDALLAVVFLGLLPSALGFVIWGYAVARLPLAASTAALYLVPPVALLVSFVWLGEIPHPVELLGGAVVVAASS